MIPTRFREARLAFALDALAEQTLPGDRFEVIVVRAADAGEGLMTEAPPGLEVEFLECAVAGAAAQRNVGWRAARGELVAFTDDDCRPAPDWLERLLEREAGDRVFLQGRTEIDGDEWHLNHGFARSMDVRKPDEWAPTCNMMYPRSLLELVDGFDERFPAAWGEDTDLALRCRALGARQLYVDEALVWHAVHPRTLYKALREGVRRSNIPLVLARHPEHRRALDMRLFVKRSHAWLTLALLGLALARRHPLLAVAAAIPYLKYRFGDREATPAGLVRFLLVTAPRHGALDATEVASLAASSARHRSLVL